MTIIAFEGIDGSGKTEQSSAFVNYLLGKGDKVCYEHEPSNEPFGHNIRDLLKNHDCDSITQTLLHNAARHNLIENVYKPALTKNCIVVLDRCYVSTLAYQGYGYNMQGFGVEESEQFKTIDAITEQTVKDYKPDLIFYLDVRLNTAEARVLARGESFDRSYMTRVQYGYDQMWRKKRMIYIPAGASFPTMQLLIQTVYENFLSGQNNA